MNKTLKTIGWICLALGLLGIMADFGALVIGRRFADDRLATIEEVQENAQKRDSIRSGQLCIAQDADGDGKPDGDCIQRPDRLQGFAPRQGGRIGGGMMQSPRLAFNRRATFGFAGLSIFLFAMGPVLAVVGAVILLVNREPKKETVVEDEKKPAKSKSAK
jgi:hypothetical protein